MNILTHVQTMAILEIRAEASNPVVTGSDARECLIWWAANLIYEIDVNMPVSSIEKTIEHINKHANRLLTEKTPA